MRGQGAPIYSSTFPPVLPAPGNTGIVGIWHPHGVCVSLTEQNHKNQTRSQSDFRADKKTTSAGKQLGQRRSAKGAQLHRDTPELATPQQPPRMLHKGSQLLVCHTVPQSSLSPAWPRGWWDPGCPSCYQVGSGGASPGALAASHPPHLSRRRLRRHKTSKSRFILGDTIQRNAENLAPRDDLSLFSPNDTCRCKELRDGIPT